MYPEEESVDRSSVSVGLVTALTCRAINARSLEVQPTKKQSSQPGIQHDPVARISVYHVRVLVHAHGRWVT